MNALEGYKILDFSTLLPGPYATMVLGDLGAEVLKVSSKDRFDLVVNWPPKVKGTEVTGAQAWLGRNKKTIFLDLKKPAAVEAVKRLVMDYDIVVEQFRPGVMDRLGIGYEALKAVNPRVIYCAITGYGQTGGFSKRAGHDINYLARSGVAYAAGRKLGGPGLYNFQIADVAGGSMGAVASILAALLYREKTGEGQFIDISMQDCVIPFNSMDGASFFAGGPEPARENGLLNGGQIYDFYETSDGGVHERRFPGTEILCGALRRSGKAGVEGRKAAADRGRDPGSEEYLPGDLPDPKQGGVDRDIREAGRLRGTGDEPRRSVPGSAS